MEAKHTPGPWGVKTSESGQSAIFSGENGQWVATTTIKFPKSTDKANARLIAAAPDLLEALRAIVALDDGDSPDLWHFDKEFSAARAAIAKATGQS